MLVVVYNAETGKYRKEQIPDPRPAESEYTMQQLKMDVDRLNHESLPPSMACKTAFHPGGGRQRW